ncbi:MAG: hypothetical protein NDJ72_08135, partial [Elusimicrobia bacterium]|nr:hypothetical protein [Elusimicrobiota bacterium]
MTAGLLLTLALAGPAPAAAPHRPAEHGEHYLPVTIGPEYIDLVTQLRAKSGRKPDFEYRQSLVKGLRVTESIDRTEAPGGHTAALLVVRSAKDKKRAQAMALAALDAEDRPDVEPRLS